MDEIEAALEQLLIADEARVGAHDNYIHAIRVCVDLGISNVKMAETIGMSEAAIRMMKHRHEIKGKRDRT